MGNASQIQDAVAYVVDVPAGAELHTRHLISFRANCQLRGVAGRTPSSEQPKRDNERGAATPGGNCASLVKFATNGRRSGYWWMLTSTFTGPSAPPVASMSQNRLDEDDGACTVHLPVFLPSAPMIGLILTVALLSSESLDLTT